MTESPLRQIPFADATGAEKTLDDLGADVVLIVNVASKCGLTPQYTQLEELQRRFGDRGFSVVGFPCNQFMGQEPGSPQEIAEFCSVSYGVTFPLSEKIEVNGEGAHPLYQWLTGEHEVDGGLKIPAVDIEWNFGKFLLDRDGQVLRRWSPQTTPEEIADDIEAALGA